MFALPALVIVALFVTQTAFGFPPEEKETELTTSIVSATIYAKEAQLTRRGTVEVATGLYRFVCKDLPRGFAESSLQVEGTGSARAVILGIDLERRRGDISDNPRYRELKARLDELSARRDSLNIGLTSLEKRSAFLAALDKLPFKEQKTEEPVDFFRVGDWKSLLDFLQSDRMETDRTIYAVKKKIEKLTEEINWIMGELNAMRVKEDWSKLVIVECEVTAPGSLTLDLGYIVPGATWVPGYTIRYRAAEETIDLVYNAGIKQATGEDWRDIEVTLSTARPHVGAAPPVIRPHYLTNLREKPMGYRWDAEEGKMEPTLVGKTREAADRAELEEAPAEQAVADISSSEFAANFRIPQSVDLESGGEPRRARILQDSFTGELSRYSAPRFSQNTYIKGEVENHLEAPLLKGTAEIYIETAPGGGPRMSNFVGKERIGPVASGETFSIHLGIDQDIKVSHKLEKRERLTREGKGKKKIRYHYLITLESFKRDTVSVAVEDRVPVSTVKEISVDDVDLEPKPDERKEDGVVTWKLELVPGVKLKIRIAYTIVFPGDWPDHFVNLE
jgi:uncharacterized protein (TIGR02231 family)